MNKKITVTKKAKLKCKKVFLHPVTNIVIDIICLLATFILMTKIFSFMHSITCILWFVAIAVKICVLLFSSITYKEYLKIKKSEELAEAMLRVHHRSHEYKIRHVLQPTYGNIPKWRPIDYHENVLPYDVHEQVRTILIELKEAIIKTTPGLDQDSVTVDMVYCYPDNKYDGQVPSKKDNIENWRIITSRDNSATNYKLHDFLENEESFYFHLDKNNYVFFNDKFAVNRYYIASGKDHEYDNTGSIIGFTVNVKNDVPEKVLVKAMVTITTYGAKLCDKGRDGLTENEYKEILKKNILNGYKTLLESELSQMYIRHMIWEGQMCPRSGAIRADLPKDGEPQRKFLCYTLNKNGECALTGTACEYSTPKSEDVQQKQKETKKTLTF